MSEETQDTPERRLWTAVLLSYFNDISIKKPRKCNQMLLKMADTKWCEFLCDLAQVDYGFFYSKLEKHYKNIEDSRYLH